jgi:hypothetical protein
MTIWGVLPGIDAGLAAAREEPSSSMSNTNRPAMITEALLMAERK